MKGHWEYECPYARCEICHTNGNRHSFQCPLHPLNICCTICGEKTHLAWDKGTCETYPLGKNPLRKGKGKGLFGAAGESSGAGASAKSFSWFCDCPSPTPGSMVTDNAPGHPWTTPGPLLYTKSRRRSAKVVQSGSRWSTVVQSGPGSTRRQNQLFNFFADEVIYLGSNVY